MAAQGYRSAPRAWPLRNAVAEAAVAAVGPEAARSLPFLQPSRRSPIGFTCADILSTRYFKLYSNLTRAQYISVLLRIAILKKG